MTYGETKAYLARDRSHGLKAKREAIKWSLFLVGALFLVPFWYNMILVLLCLVAVVRFRRAWSARTIDVAHWEDVLFRARDLWGGEPHLSLQGFKETEPPDGFVLDPKKLWPEKYGDRAG